MLFNDFYPLLHEHHLENYIVIYHGATLNDYHICCNPTFAAYSKFYITSSDDISAIRLKGYALPPGVRFDKDKLENLMMEHAPNSIVTHSGACTMMAEVRRVYEIKNKNIRRVPVDEYILTITSHGYKIDI